MNSPTGDLGRERKEEGRRREGNACAHMPTAHVSELTEGEGGKKKDRKGKKKLKMCQSGKSSSDISMHNQYVSQKASLTANATQLSALQ